MHSLSDADFACLSGPRIRRLQRCRAMPVFPSSCAAPAQAVGGLGAGSSTAGQAVVPGGCGDGGVHSDGLGSVKDEGYVDAVDPGASGDECNVRDGILNERSHAAFGSIAPV